MKISGFTFVRNAVKFDYPVIESITSILPLCDEFIINAGDSEDGTMDCIKSIDSEKIKIIESVWDESLRSGGHVLAQQTDIALSHCTGDWCFYIQADEVVHERYLGAVRQAAEQYIGDKRVQGLLFNYLHFYGCYNYVGASRRWYRREVRVIRNNIGITSYKDAQGFRLSGKKIQVKPVDAYIFHYGWVKPPSVQQDKQKNFNRLWHPDAWVEQNVGKANEYDYNSTDILEPFTETHPAAMKKRIERINWEYTYDAERARKNMRLRHRILNAVEKRTGFRLGEYKNYRII